MSRLFEPSDHLAEVGLRAPLQSDMRPLRVGFVLANNFTLSAFAEFVDVLRLAADDADYSRPIRCRWHVLSSTDEPIKSSCGLFISPTSRFMDPLDLDCVVVVAGLLHRHSPLDRDTTEYLIRVARTRVNLVGICTGSFVLCRLGLMEGRKCCISWFHYRDFLREFDNLVPIADQTFVIDGNRITCPGGLGTIFLAAELVARHLGASTAQKVLHMLQIDRMKPGSSMQPAPPLGAISEDDRISRALLLMEQNLSNTVSISNIASNLHTSTRQLERRFKEVVGCSPQAAYLQLRLRHARWMLASNLSLASIAAETGFSDGAHFGRAFKVAYGINPSEARKQRNQETGLFATSARDSNEAIRVFGEF